MSIDYTPRKKQETYQKLGRGTRPGNIKPKTAITSSSIRETKKVGESKVTPGAATSLQPTKIYTGDKMIGISIIHKSCLQPIFNEEAAKDAASMRR